jgi:hypothetical protein
MRQRTELGRVLSEKMALAHSLTISKNLYFLASLVEADQFTRQLPHISHGFSLSRAAAPRA